MIKKIGLIRIYPVPSPPIICMNNDGVIAEGEIYYRYNARSEKIKYPELKLIFEKIRESERASWMTHLERISKVGAQNVAIFDMSSGRVSGAAGSFLIDSKLLSKLKFIRSGSFQEGGSPTLSLIGELQPVHVVTRESDQVQITDDPTAPSLRLEEETLLRQHFPLSYDEMVKQLRKRYSDFLMNKKFQDVHKSLKGDKTLYRERFLDIDNPKSSKKGYYSPLIIKQFDKYFTLKKK